MALASLTGPLSSSGLRSLFPLLVPEPLWERVNAVDSNGWVLATVVGAPVGAVVAQVIGFEVAMTGIAAAYASAALVMVGAPDPRTDVASSGNLLRDAWLGLVYTWNNRTLRALAISLSTMNLSGGVIEIVVPVLILKHLGMGQDMVGYMFGLSGAFGVVSAFISGRIKTEGRERRMILIPAAGFVFTSAILLWPGSILPIALSMAVAGLLNGPLDIALFTLRQRRTDPAWMGRAFTVSMNLNFSGFPIGAAADGVMLSIWPVEVAIVFGVAANVLGALLGYAADPPRRRGGPTRTGRCRMERRRPFEPGDEPRVESREATLVARRSSDPPSARRRRDRPAPLRCRLLYPAGRPIERLRARRP